ncbi:Hypothetical predicted protein [Podarcis lilfordi]|uniref:Uncharacterized protein n=1 Tax=Podarcis lilfordi TaxID=74358 RepID=A0AA35PGI5_9SAUR|nr:Hypothetical predicted protein [Podarcis lilfordi]
MCCKETCLRAICLQQRGSSMQQRLPTATGAPAKPLQRVRKAGADGRGNALDGAKAGLIRPRLTDPISPPFTKQQIHKDPTKPESLPATASCNTHKQLERELSHVSLSGHKIGSMRSRA